MPSWKGDPQNPVPDISTDPINQSGQVIADNRALQVRRDKDTQKDFTISLYDIDETILLHLEQMQLQVEDAGRQIKVPIFYGSPEKWTSAQRDGYLRDKTGKLILPAMVIKRTNSENDPSLQYFNRYLTTRTMRLFSPKNQYTKFSVLMGKNAPTNEVFNIVFPSHMVLTYNFIVWTEYVEQMNKLVEHLQFDTKDYWGSKRGFRFRTRIESFGHTTELQSGEDRIVKTEFQLITHGYIIPDSMTKLENHLMTTQKEFTPKKVIISAETVRTSFDLNQLDDNVEKHRNPNYPNLREDVVIPPPPFTVSTDVNDATNPHAITSSL
jgi:hypothetical protein